MCCLLNADVNSAAAPARSGIRAGETSLDAAARRYHESMRQGFSLEDTLIVSGPDKKTFMTSNMPEKNLYSSKDTADSRAQRSLSAHWKSFKRHLP